MSDSSDPIYVYDSRTQFTRPLFVVYEHEHVDAFLMALDPESAGLGWRRPDWVYVTMQRMHTYQKDRYKSTSSTSVRNSPVKTSAIKRAKKREIDLTWKLKEKERRIVELEAEVERWRTDTSSMTADAALKLLTETATKISTKEVKE